jgi:hypothetical protein
MLAIMGHMSRAMLERYSHICMAAKREALKSLELPKVGPRLVAPMSGKRAGVRYGPYSFPCSHSWGENQVAVSD